MNLPEKRVDPSHPLKCKRKLDIPRHNSKPSILSYLVFKFRFGFCLMPWKIFPYLLKVATFAMCIEQMPLVSIQSWFIFCPFTFQLTDLFSPIYDSICPHWAKYINVPTVNFAIFPKQPPPLFGSPKQPLQPGEEQLAGSLMCLRDGMGTNMGDDPSTRHPNTESEREKKTCVFFVLTSWGKHYEKPWHAARFSLKLPWGWSWLQFNFQINMWKTHARWQHVSQVRVTTWRHWKHCK